MILLLFFSTIALVDLELAQIIVTIGFATILIAISSISIIMKSIGEKGFIEQIGNTLKEERQKKQE